MIITGIKISHYRVFDSVGGHNGLNHSGIQYRIQYSCFGVIRSVVVYVKERVVTVYVDLLPL